MLMFACIYGEVSSEIRSEQRPDANLLVDLAFTFSPLVEQTASDTIVLEISGQGLLFGSSSHRPADDLESSRNLAYEIVRRATQTDLQVNVSVASNPDAAIHSARCFKGVIVITPGEELAQLSHLAIKYLDYSLADIEEKRVEEIRETLRLWGIRTFGELARLPLSGVAQRLGQEGVRLQKLAQGKSERHLVLVQPPIGFSQTLELEHPIAELEPLSFILSRLLNQLCANLNMQALATNELRLKLVAERCSEYRLQSGIDAVNKSPTEVDTQNTADLHERTITLPVPMCDPKTLLRLLLLDIEAHPPAAPIILVTIAAEPIKPRISQTGLFVPLAPEPEKLEVTLARLAKLVGADKVGSPEPLNTHRPDAFRMTKFRLNQRTARNIRKRSRFALNADGTPSLPVMGFRIFRPPWPAEVQIRDGQPVRISARSAISSLRGKVTCAAGPWRGSGDWWTADVWARDEWDVAVADSNRSESERLCRIYRDLISDKWFVEGMYD